MNTFLAFVPITAGIILLFATIGGIAYYAFRQGFSKESGAAQTVLIASLQAEMQLLRTRNSDQEKRITELEIRQETLIEALGKKGIKVTMDGTMVTIVDRQGSSTVRGTRARPATIQKKTQP